MTADAGDRDTVGADTVDHPGPAADGTGASNTDGTGATNTDGNGEATTQHISGRSADGLGHVVADRVRDHEESLARVRAVTNVVPARTFDHDKIRRGVRLLLEGIGEDPDREGLRNTPDRVAREYDEVFAGLLVEPSEVISAVFSEGHDEIVMMREIPFHSMCEHHLLPWFGQAHVAYLPSEDGFITGLSKLARVVDVCAKRPGVQERMTTMVADAIEQKLQPRGVLVVVEARHLCMEMRGIRKPGAETVTSTVRGRFRDDPKTRAEAFALLSRD